MIFNPDKHHRKSIRLQGYDYSQPWAYFVTICVQNRECLFGKLENGEMQLNEAGKMVNNWWDRLPQKYPNVELDEFIVMPNHLHGIIIVGADPRVCPDTNDNNNVIYDDKHIGSNANISGEHKGSPLQKPVALSHMIQWFKTLTTNEYIRNIKQNDWHPFDKRLW